MPYELENDEDEVVIYQCRHIFTDGHRCGSPALRNEHFCYFHHTSRRPIQDAPKRKRRQTRFALPNPEDRSAIQSSVGQVLQRLANNDLDPRRAGLILYGLQIASLNLGKHIPAKPADTVEEVTIDPTHGALAPEVEYDPSRLSGKASGLDRLLTGMLRDIRIQELPETKAPKPAQPRPCQVHS